MMLQLSYPKQVSARMESLLMIVPLVVLVLANIFTHSASLDTHFPDTYFSFSFGNVAFFSWALLIIPFILHLFLKQEGIGNEAILSAHIIISLAMLVIVLFTYQIYTNSGIVGSPFLGMPYQRQWMEATSSTYALLMAQSALQILFTIYALLKLVP